MSETHDEPIKRYKVGRVLDKHGLYDTHSTLADRWLGEDGEAQSLRTLADEINVEILRQKMEAAGMDPLEGEADNAYQLLTGDDVSVGMSAQQRNRLEHAGIEVEDLEGDFVTHQAVYTYLTKALDVSKEQSDDLDPVEKHRQRIQRLQSRTEAVSEDSLEELTKADEITLGRHNVSLDIQVYCHECNSQHDVATLLQNGGCQCR